MPEKILERSDAVISEKEEKLWSVSRGGEGSRSGVMEEEVATLSYAILSSLSTQNQLALSSKVEEILDKNSNTTLMTEKSFDGPQDMLSVCPNQL